jgi:hypothetical protein
MSMHWLGNTRQKGNWTKAAKLLDFQEILRQFSRQRMGHRAQLSAIIVEHHPLVLLLRCPDRGTVQGIGGNNNGMRTRKRRWRRRSCDEPRRDVFFWKRVRRSVGEGGVAGQNEPGNSVDMETERQPCMMRWSGAATSAMSMDVCCVSLTGHSYHSYCSYLGTTEIL